MMRRSVMRPGVPLALAVFIAAGCYGVKDTRFTAAQRSTEPAVSKEAVAGSKLNKYFPKAEGEWDVVFTQEKQGTSIATLKKGGKETGTLAIFDTVSDPSLRDDFKEAADKLEGHPVVAKGNLGTAVLVADRYQVVVRAMPGVAFPEAERKEWLKKFDLAGLATLQ